MANPSIGVVITGRSDVAQVLAATDKQMQAFRRSVETNSRQIQKMTQTSGLGELTKGFKGVSEQSFQFYQNVTRAVDSLGVLTGAGSITGVLALSRSLSTLGQSQLNASRLINMAPQQLVAWQNAAHSAGATAADATSSITEMEKARSQMMNGLDQGGMGYATQALGNDWVQKYRNDYSLILAMSKKLSGLHGDQKAEAIAQLQGAFHISTGFAEFLSRGPSYVQAAFNKGMQSAPNASQLGNLDDLSTSFGDLENSITGAAEAGAASIAPVLIPALNTMSDWIDHHQRSFDIFATTLGVIGTGLGYKAIKGLLGSKGGVPTSPEPPATPKVPPATSSVPGVEMGAPEGLSPSLWARLAPASLELGASILPAAAIALWPETPGNDSLHLSRGQMKTMAPNAAVIAAAMKAQGAPSSFIAAALGNFAWETGGTLDPHQQQAGGGPGFAIAQWEPARQALFKQLEGVDIHQATIQQETDFFLREMQNRYPQTYAQLMSGKLSTEQATKLFMQTYEAPKDKDNPTGSIVPRTSYAEQFGSVLPPDASGTGMSAEDRGSPLVNMSLDERAAAVAASSGNIDPGAGSGEYQSAVDGKWHSLDGGSQLTPTDDDGHHVTVDVNIKHDGTVLTRQRQSSPGVTARVKTVTAMPTAGGLY